MTGGPDWFAALPEERQREIAGHSMWEAMNAGAVRWQDISRPYSDDLFGRMIGENSLRGILGADAEMYYGKK